MCSLLTGLIIDINNNTNFVSNNNSITMPLSDHSSVNEADIMACTSAAAGSAYAAAPPATAAANALDLQEEEDECDVDTITASNVTSSSEYELDDNSSNASAISLEPLSQQSRRRQRRRGPKRRFMESVASTHSFTSSMTLPLSSPPRKQRRLSRPSSSQQPSSIHNSTFDNVATETSTATATKPTIKMPATASSATAAKKSPKMNQIYNVLLQINPKEYAKAGFRANGFSVEQVREQATSNFQDPITTKAMTDQYTNEIVRAFRQCDLPTIKQFVKDGKLTSNASNVYGESVLHIASRRGNVEMLKFLIEELHVDPRKYCDDYGRTALHDACWTPTSEPAFDVVDLLLEYSPEHLLLKDKRGFTPLDYIRPNAHGKWLRFLWERKTKLRPSSSSEGSILGNNTEDQHQTVVG
mmetsp:Transcript_2112/g.4896  ORF Transcript_2112/g.4896 Transcript_2112/m.4896 type:complete len:413 (+) Transcript_2112:230-1468(+)